VKSKYCVTFVIESWGEDHEQAAEYAARLLFSENVALNPVVTECGGLGGTEKVVSLGYPSTDKSWRK
jgi:hypothetical protein